MMPLNIPEDLAVAECLQNGSRRCVKSGMTAMGGAFYASMMLYFRNERNRKTGYSSRQIK
jgi:hypothetical protein